MDVFLLGSALDNKTPKLIGAKQLALLLQISFPPECLISDVNNAISLPLYRNYMAGTRKCKIV